MTTSKVIETKTTVLMVFNGDEDKAEEVHVTYNISNEITTSFPGRD